MDNQIVFILCLTFIIHLITTLAYSVRIVGTRTGKIFIAASLFNILALSSRVASSAQGPLLAKYVEGELVASSLSTATANFRWILLATTLATAVGIAMMPTFQRSFGKVVEGFDIYRSVPRLLLHGFSKSGIYHLRTSVAIPSTTNLGSWRAVRRLPFRLLVANTLIEALFIVGAFAALYAGYLEPELRLTAVSLSPVITGIATIVLFLFINPYLSIMTDDVLKGETSQLYLTRIVALLVGSRLAGTILAQIMLVPAAYLIIAIAELL